LGTGIPAGTVHALHLGITVKGPALARFEVLVAKVPRAMIRTDAADIREQRAPLESVFHPPLGVGRTHAGCIILLLAFVVERPGPVPARDVVQLPWTRVGVNHLVRVVVGVDNETEQELFLVVEAGSVGGL
jgi:hypothetical protein